MALINCRNCDTSISSKAKACPKCGMLIHEENFLLMVTIYAVFILASAIVYLRFSQTGGIAIMVFGCLTFAFLIFRKLS